VLPADLGLRDPVAGVYVHALGEQTDEVAVSARAFCPDLGIVEDPATGSAAVALGIALVARGVLPSGGDYVIRQGVEMGRPSTLHGRVVADGGRASRCEVGGGVVSAASGTLAVPPG
jgi:trans-2,3-dihydro-3-hydroxyanthranilate isomerase